MAGIVWEDGYGLGTGDGLGMGSGDGECGLGMGRGCGTGDGYGNGRAEPADDMGECGWEAINEVKLSTGTAATFR